MSSSAMFAYVLRTLLLGGLLTVLYLGLSDGYELRQMHLFNKRVAAWEKVPARITSGAERGGLTLTYRYGKDTYRTTDRTVEPLRREGLNWPATVRRFEREGATVYLNPDRPEQVALIAAYPPGLLRRRAVSGGLLTVVACVLTYAVLRPRRGLADLLEGEEKRKGVAAGVGVG